MNRRVLWLLVLVVTATAAWLALAPSKNELKPAGKSIAESLMSAPGKDTDTADDAENGPSVAKASGEEVTVETPSMIDPETEKPMLPPLALQKGELPWEGRLKSVIDAKDLTEPQKAHALLDLLPTIPAEGAETCAEEAVKRLPNAEYKHGQIVVINSSTYGLALGVLFADLMGRPDDLRLPTLVAIARNSAHPYAEPARNNLDLLIGKDFGSDWPKWEAAVRERLSAR